MKTLLDLFDHSGTWAEPFEQAGWNVIQLELKHGVDLLQFQSVEDVFDFGIEDVHGIIAAPPCTDFAVSGAQYWTKKDLAGFTAKSLELVHQVQRFADLFTPTDPDYEESFFWALENPVGRLPQLVPELEAYGKAYWFQPCDFTGHLKPSRKVLDRLDVIRAKNGKGVTNEECDFVVKWNAYNKKTGLWGNFNRNLTVKPVEPVRCSEQGSFTQRLGTKSEKTKEQRSNTPLGFAKAFFQANHDWTGWYQNTFPE